VSPPPFPDHIVEEADIGICADGWDNFLLYDDTSELEEYLAALEFLKASRCAAVIKELLDLVAANRQASAIKLTDSHKEKLHTLWHRYDEASCAESPQELSKRAFAERQSGDTE
jgi:hypothetical protein